MPAFPSQTAPTLSLPTLSGETFTLANRNPDKFTIVVFYRGLHCPLCSSHLKEIEERLDAVTAAGMEIVAVSMDDQAKASETSKRVAASLSTPAVELKATIAYGLTEDAARSWGLYISKGMANSAEPAVFSEPGIAVIQPDNKVFMIQVQSAPFSRPSIDQLLGGLQYAFKNKYPFRGNCAVKCTT